MIRVIVHHAPERTLPRDPTREQVAAQIRIMEDWHAEKHTPTNPRISYQWIVVEQTGEIWEGIGWDRIGAHVGGHNTASLGILILGVDGRYETGSDRTWKRVAEIVQEGIRRGALIARPELSPHNRYVATTCPGGVLTRHVAQLTVDELLALLVEPEPSVVPEPLGRPVPEPPSPPEPEPAPNPAPTPRPWWARLLDLLLRRRR